jgi:hypothetical protein
MVFTSQFFGVGLGEANVEVAAAKRTRRPVSFIFIFLEERRGGKGNTGCLIQLNRSRRVSKK